MAILALISALIGLWLILTAIAGCYYACKWSWNKVAELFGF